MRPNHALEGTSRFVASTRRASVEAAPQLGLVRRHSQLLETQAST